MKIFNRRARHNYHILESFEAGLILLGSEAKSIREGRIDLSEGFVKVLNNEAFLLNVNIPRYEQTTQRNYDPLRTRKLLLHKNQIASLIGKTSGKGATLIPLAIYQKNNKFKLEVALARNKKQFDKRRAIKERDQIRKIEQELRPKE